MILEVKDDIFKLDFEKAFVKDWNRLCKKNPTLGKIKEDDSGVYGWEDPECRLKNLLSIVARSVYSVPVLKSTLLTRNVIEIKDKYCDNECQLVVINLDKAKDFLSDSEGNRLTQFQGEKWPRIFIGFETRTKRFWLLSLTGHEDKRYNNEYDSKCSESLELLKYNIQYSDL